MDKGIFILFCVPLFFRKELEARVTWTPLKEEEARIEGFYRSILWINAWIWASRFVKGGGRFRNLRCRLPNLFYKISQPQIISCIEFSNEHPSKHSALLQFAAHHLKQKQFWLSILKRAFEVLPEGVAPCAFKDSVRFSSGALSDGTPGH